MEENEYVLLLPTNGRFGSVSVVGNMKSNRVGGMYAWLRVNVVRVLHVRKSIMLELVKLVAWVR